MPINIRAAGFVGGEETDGGSFIVDEGDYDAGFAILSVDSPDVLRIGEFDPGGAIGLDGA